MKRSIVVPVVLLLLCLLCPVAYATHIEYVDLVDDILGVNEDGTGVNIYAGDTWTWTFDLLTDSMYLWKIDTPSTGHGGGSGPPDVTTADYTGSYDIASALHYVFLRIDPNNVNLNGGSGGSTSASTYIGLTVNGYEIEDWSNKISLYDWGVPGDNISDLYEIALNGYKIEIVLTGLTALGSNSIFIDNVNIEGCFDKAIPNPEPASCLLLGIGLLGFAGIRRKIKK